MYEIYLNNFSGINNVLKPFHVHIAYFLFCLTLFSVFLTTVFSLTVFYFKDVEYDNIRPEGQQTVIHPAGVSTARFPATNTDFDPDGLYANYSYHQRTRSAADYNYSKDASLNSASISGVNSSGACAESRVTDAQCDLVYSVAQLPKEQIELTGDDENDLLYSLAQLPQAP